MQKRPPHYWHRCMNLERSSFILFCFLFVSVCFLYDIFFILCMDIRNGAVSTFLFDCALKSVINCLSVPCLYLLLSLFFVYISDQSVI